MGLGSHDCSSTVGYFSGSLTDFFFPEYCLPTSLIYMKRVQHVDLHRSPLSVVTKTEIRTTNTRPVLTNTDGDASNN